jgi:dolichol-phosphate mannosyltransferase
VAIGNRHFPHMEALAYKLDNIWSKTKCNLKFQIRSNGSIKNLSNIKWKNLLKFASVGASGAIINLLFLWILTYFGHLFYILSAIIAIESSILWNFTLNTKFTFNYNFLNIKSLIDSIIRYHLASFLGLIINLSVLFFLTEFIKINYIISEAIAILLAFGFNYALSINYVWCKKS